MTPAAPAATDPASDTAAVPVTFARVLHSEWIKLRTLRSTWLGLGAVVAVLAGFDALAAAVSSGSVSIPEGVGPSGFSGDDPLTTVLTGANFAVLLVGVLGCWAGAREHGSRMINVTTAATPRRWTLVVAKAGVVAAVTLPAALLGVLGAFAIGMGVLSVTDAATVSLYDEGVLRSVLGMAGYLTAISLLGLGLGLLLRSVASSIGRLIAGVLWPPALAGPLLPDSLDNLLQVLPSNAAAAFTVVQATGDQLLGAAAGALVLTAWVVVVLVAAIGATLRPRRTGRSHRGHLATRRVARSHSVPGQHGARFTWLN